MKLSANQRKNADRIGGIELMLPWPRAWPPEKLPSRDVPASPQQHVAMRDFLSAECKRCGLLHVRTFLARVERPMLVWRPAETLPHVGVVLIGFRWVAASARPPVTMWSIADDTWLG